MDIKDIKQAYEAIKKVEANERKKMDSAAEHGALFSPYSKQWATVALSFLDECLQNNFCEPSGCILKSYPPQYKCKHCEQTWPTECLTPKCLKDGRYIN